MHLRNLKYIFSIFIIAVISIAAPHDAGAFDLSTYTASSRLSEGRWVRVQVERDGIYKITQSDISKWGFSTLANIRVYGYGGAPLSDVLTLDNYIDDLPQTPVLRTGNAILFFGKGPETWKTGDANDITYRQIQHPYATAGYYFITESTETEDLAFELKDNKSATEGELQDWFTERVYHEKELLSPGMTGRLLLGEDFKYKTTQSFEFALKGIVPGHEVQVATSFAAKVMNGNSFLNFKQNGITVTGKSAYIYPVTDPAHEHLKMVYDVRKFKTSGEKLSYTLIYSYNGTLYKAYLDYITVNYRRALKMENSSLPFRAVGIKRMSVAGTTSETKILDITDPAKPFEIKTTGNDGNRIFSTYSAGNHEYIAFNPSASYPSPTFVENVANQNLHAEAIPEMIIITPAEFRAQAQRIADMHLEMDCMKVLVVTPQPIYNEFSSGMPDMNAYRRLAKMFYDRGNAIADTTKLKYLLMFGRSSYDNRQITEPVKKNNYPKLLTWESVEGDNESTSYNTDDILAFLDDNARYFKNEKLRIAVGRMPVKSVTEAKQMVDKLIEYTQNKNQGVWKNSILAIADDEDNGVHMEQMDDVLNRMNSGDGKKYFFNHVYLDAYTATSAGAGRFYPDAKKEMFEKLNQGCLWVNYIGHANPQSWTHDGLLNITDMQTKFFYNNLPLFYTATCEFTRWDSDVVSGGELLYLNTAGGAIALISTSRVVYISDNGVLSNYIASQVFKKEKDGQYQRIGDILKNAKNSYPGGNNNKLRYSLTGDPALRLNYPTENIKIDRINTYKPGDADAPVIQASSQVEIEGRIVDAMGNTEEDFNGIITPKFYDAQESVETNGYGENGKKHVFYEYSNMLYMGQDSVKKGKFLIKFNMPSEITNNYSEALINLYANSDKGVEANGYFNNLFVYGYDESGFEDSKGPEIEYLTLNGSSFEDGGSVNESPMVMAAVSDENGINLSSAGIGHQMTILLDNSVNIEDVANYYTPTIGKNGGTIAYPLSNLEPGEHSLRFKVWDINNNSSEKTITFKVVPGLAPEMYDVYTTANPASVETKFYVTHNRPGGYITVKLEVFDLMGRPVWSKIESGKSEDFTSFPVCWDLNDNAGRRVSRGIYIYRASISAQDGGEATTKSKKIAVTAQ